MTPIEHAMNGITLDEIEKEATPTIEKHWTLEYLGRIGRPSGISFKTKKGFTNEI